MELFKELYLIEGQRRSDEAIEYAITSINGIYNEWKKTKRRRNAVSIVTTSVNKLCTIEPDVIDRVHNTAKEKLATIIMRCLDVAPWIDPESKRITYRRLYPLLNKVQGIDPNTGSGGKLRDIIMTRFSATISNRSDDLEQKDVFVGYEPTLSKRYIRHIFGEEMPNIVCKMQTLSLPEDFDTLLKTLKINHTKACDRYLNNGEKHEQYL